MLAASSLHGFRKVNGPNPYPLKYPESEWRGQPKNWYPPFVTKIIKIIQWRLSNERTYFPGIRYSRSRW
jgi:hypothetical protein